MLTVDKVVRSLRHGIAPHLHHQQAWQTNGEGIWCARCMQLVVDARTIAATSILSEAARDRIRESVSRWIREQSPESARLIFKM